MNVPLKQDDIGIRSRFKGYERKSCTFYHLVDGMGLSEFYASNIMWNIGSEMIEKQYSYVL